ncbi:tricalbin [Acrasis kona]|uniref:Tricalbin n=1 Tax=Acrasis kona TaxID=1008807 RepID=A0AAW2ZHZ7_9EUKA
MTDNSKTVYRSQYLEKQGKDNTGPFLEVFLERADGIASSDVNGLSDPYVNISIGNESVRSQTIMKSLNPVFYQALFISLHEVEDVAKINFEVMDWDKFSKDDLCGTSSLELDISKTVSGVTVPHVLIIQPQGSIYVRLTVHNHKKCSAAL